MTAEWPCDHRRMTMVHLHQLGDALVVQAVIRDAEEHPLGRLAAQLLLETVDVLGDHSRLVWLPLPLLLMLLLSFPRLGLFLLLLLLLLPPLLWWRWGSPSSDRAP